MGQMAHACMHTYMSVWPLTQVEALALQKWGGQEGLDQERQKRQEKRLERARAKAGECRAAHAGAPCMAGVMGLGRWCKA